MPTSANEPAKRGKCSRKEARQFVGPAPEPLKKLLFALHKFFLEHPEYEMEASPTVETTADKNVLAS